MLGAGSCSDAVAIRMSAEGASPEVDDVLAELRRHFHHERYQWSAVVARETADFSPEEFSTLRAL